MARRRAPEPPIQMRELLTEHRREGWSFTLAWEASWRVLIWPHSTPHRQAWREALIWAQPEFEAAYNREPSAVADVLARIPPEAIGTREVPGDQLAGAVHA